MQFLKTAFFLSILIFVAGPCVAQFEKLEDAEEWIIKLNQHSSEIKSLHAEFEQHKKLSFLEEAVISSGQFWFLDPHKIRWEYKSPYSYIMIIDDGVLTVKDSGEEYSNDLSSNQMFKQMNQLISGSIQGNLLNDETNYSKEFYHNSQYIMVKLFPLDKQLVDYLDYMEIWFDKASLNVSVLLLHEPSGDDTRMNFINTVVNENISADVFK